MSTETEYTQAVMELADLKNEQIMIDLKVAAMEAKMNYLKQTPEVKARIEELLKFENDTSQKVIACAREKIMSSSQQGWSAYATLTRFEEFAEMLTLPNTGIVTYYSRMLAALGIEPTTGRVALRTVYNNDIDAYVSDVLKIAAAHEA